MQLKMLLDEAKLKNRNFVESVELQFGLQNYDPRKDRRFAGSIELPYPVKYKSSICIIGDQEDCDKAKALGIPFKDLEEMKLFKKDKKLIKKFYAKYDTILCSESLIRSLPRVLGPLTGRITKFPAVYTKNDVLSKRVDIIKRTVKIQMKKVLCIPLAVGNVTLTEAQLVN